jgi:hypothetical protein
MPKMEVEVIAFAINLLILAPPTIGLVVAWNRLVGDRRNEVVQSAAIKACLAFASASTLVALGSLLAGVCQTYLVTRLSDGGVWDIVLCRESRRRFLATRRARASVLAT